MWNCTKPLYVANSPRNIHGFRSRTLLEPPGLQAAHGSVEKWRTAVVSSCRGGAQNPKPCECGLAASSASSPKPKNKNCTVPLTSHDPHPHLSDPKTPVVASLGAWQPQRQQQEELFNQSLVEHRPHLGVRPVPAPVAATVAATRWTHHDAPLHSTDLSRPVQVSRDEVCTWDTQGEATCAVPGQDKHEPDTKHSMSDSTVNGIIYPALPIGAQRRPISSAGLSSSLLVYIPWGSKTNQ